MTLWHSIYKQAKTMLTVVHILLNFCMIKKTFNMLFEEQQHHTCISSTQLNVSETNRNIRINVIFGNE